MIDFYTAETPNGYRVELMLEELGLSYNKHLLSLSKNEHRSTEFLKLNPSGRIPVIVDHKTMHKSLHKTKNKNKAELVLTQSGAILLYLAEKTGRLIPKEIRSRAKTYECFCSDISDIATTRFDAFFLSLHKQTEAKQLLKERTMEYYAVYEKHLASNHFLAGDEYSIADVAAYPWAKTMKYPEFAQFQQIQNWMSRVEQRPAVQKTFLLEETQHEVD